MKFFKIITTFVVDILISFFGTEAKGRDKNSCPTVKNVFVSLVQLLVLTAP